ncbi:Protein of unknown function [Cotesia congregata]|uniref:F-box domain-containing protein n=1 Tax=Cotesia congregata TaxID=51543 RepID=A0A8J2EC45_COTCN|nr:Protein of unknown function [Cotesia congregata]
MFPTEIWELIINFINDPGELMRLRCVCRKFHDLIEVKLVNSKLWENLCLEHNILPWKDHIVRTRFPKVVNNKNFSLDLHQRTWKRIFFSYKKWSVLPKVEKKYDSFDFGGKFGDGNASITCTSIWSNVGLTHRFFSEWNCRITEHEWNAPHLSVKRSFDFCCPNHGDCTRKILAMYHDDNGLILKALADSIYIFTYTIDFLENGRRNITITEFYKLHPDKIEATDLFIRYIAINKVAFVADNKHLYILFDGLGTKMSDENYSTRGPYRRFQIPVSSIIMHSNLIIMGLTDGTLCLKYFNEFKDLDTINFRVGLFRTVKLDTKPIISLNITDFNGNPSVIASTESTVHLLHYLSKV